MQLSAVGDTGKETMNPEQQSYDKESDACRLAIDISTENRDRLPAIIDDLVASSRDPNLLAHVDAELVPSVEKAVEGIDDISTSRILRAKKRKTYDKKF